MYGVPRVGFAAATSSRSLAGPDALMVMGTVCLPWVPFASITATVEPVAMLLATYTRFVDGSMSTAIGRLVAVPVVNVAVTALLLPSMTVKSWLELVLYVYASWSIWHYPCHASINIKCITK